MATPLLVPELAKVPLQNITYCDENTSCIDLPGRFGSFTSNLSVSHDFISSQHFSPLCLCPQLHFMPLCVLPHREVIGPSIILKRISSKKPLVWNLLHLWRSEQSCSAGGSGKMKSLFNLNVTYKAAADSLPTASIVPVGWALGINRPQSPAGLEHAQLNVKSLTKVALHSHLANHTAARPFGFLLFVLRIEG